MDYRVILLLSLFFSASCTFEEGNGETEEVHIVTTTGMIEDAVRNIGRDSVKVEALMGPGIDPHLYKATQGDLEKLRAADLVLYNGLRLEGKMGDILEDLKRIKPVVAVAENIPKEELLTLPQYNNAYDPHIWFDVSLWKKAVTKIGEALMDEDNANADFYRQNMEEYLTSLDTLHQYVQRQISTIPERQRVLITAHDAFGYFGRAYNIEVRGLQGISTLSEPGIRDIKELVDFIIENEIKAVFVETSVSERAIKAVVEGAIKRGFDLEIGGNLFSDAMGQKGTVKGTYIGMVQANVETIVKALK